MAARFPYDLGVVCLLFFPKVFLKMHDGRIECKIIHCCPLATYKTLRNVWKIADK